MTAAASRVAGCVSGYAARLHAVAGSRHHVASPLGAWLLLALAAPASTGADRDVLTQLLECDADSAAQAAARLLADPHPLVAAAAAVWTAAGRQPGPAFERWRGQLPPAVTTGDLPGQAGLNAWAREHTFGLIDSFGVGGNDLDLVLATALATKVSWRVPFELAPGRSLGTASPWAVRLDRVLRTPAQPRGGHAQFIAVTPDAGDVIVQVATAAGGLLVISVAAVPQVPAATVLAAAHRIGIRLAVGEDVDRRHLASLPLGDGPLWRLREVTAMADSCVAVLPAWSASSDHELADPALGFAAASDAVAPGRGRWQARQSAVARYSRTGFAAAAVTAVAVAMAARTPAIRREATLIFGHPYAVVAIAIDPDGPTARTARPSPWRGLPVFSAWVGEPDDAADDTD